MADMYTIKEETLVDIGNALRARHGETKVVNVEPTVLDVIVSKTDNATGFDSISGSSDNNSFDYDVIKCEGATQINLKIGYALQYSSTAEGWCDELRIAKGEHTSSTFPRDSADIVISSWQNKADIPWTVAEYTFENTDSITIQWDDGWNTKNTGYYAEATMIQKSKVVKNTYSSAAVAEAINSLPKSMPDEGYLITGDCMYMFYNGRLDWYINEFGEDINTKDITSFSNMFSGSNVEKIPFTLKGKQNFGVSCDGIFKEMRNLKELPRLEDVKVTTLSNFLYGAWNIRTLPDDFVDMFDWSYMKTNTASYYGSTSNIFYNCHSLRCIPVAFMDCLSSATSNSGSYFYSGFCQCFSLDTLEDLPIVYEGTWTSNAFSSTFTNCYRLKNITFKMPDGQPYVKNWKSQLIDLSNSVGYSMGASYSSTYILSKNSGITIDKCVSDDATYQALKDDPDWYTNDINYSRYNHDSAVATINTLPDTSAYLASAGGTNTIKFKKGSGAKTESGSTSDLTAEEIAIATAKGWTVTLY